ncbi:hypothetical protein [Terricaulis sp.]|uniref:hypothetical protein n=1 Tax=Terricaulis sp. TaxID=2768686 RepID=UPI003783646F
MSQPKRSWASATPVHVAFGFLVMGAWGVFANRVHPLPQALLAGLVQGALSGTITLFLKKGLERMNKMFMTARQSDEGIGRTFAALVVPPVVTVSIISTILISVHSIAGTPEIAATVAVPLLVSTSYAIIYNFNLWKAAVR